MLFEWLLVFSFGVVGTDQRWRDKFPLAMDLMVVILTTHDRISCLWLDSGVGDG